MKKILIIALAVIILPAALMAGFNFGLIKAAKKTVDKVDEKVVNKKAAPAVGNHVPVISSVVANPASISTGAVSAITCTASDADGDILTYTWSAVSGTISGTGATINWTAPASSSTYTISVTVSDGHGGSTQSSVNVTVTKQNNSPVISALVANPTTISTGAVSAITCTASDADGDTLTYTWSAASGTISGTGATINWTAPASSSTYAINVTVSDGHGGSAQSSVNIPVTKQNNPPTISSLVANPTSISTGATSAITCTASDLDGDTLTYSWSAASGTISGTGATINWTAPSSSSTYAINVTVSDGHGGSAQADVNVTVTKQNNPPTISSLVANPASISTGATTSITCTASDLDGDTLTYAWSAASGTITGTGATISWTAPALPSTYIINLTVSDGHGGSVQTSTNVFVTGWITYTTANGLANDQVTSIVIEGSNKWFGTMGGVSKFTGTSWTTYTTANGLTYDYVLSIAIDGLGNKWFGTSAGGVSEFAEWPSGTWTTYTQTNGLVDNYVFAIAIDGYKWFGTTGGGAPGGGVSKFTEPNFWTTFTTANGLVNNSVYSIAIDGSGNKWFGTNGGISKYDGTNWTTYTTANGLVNNSVYSIAIDSSGNKWFGTAGGVSIFDGTNWTSYTTTNGLTNNTVRAIAIDGSGNKWFGTAGGVSKFDGTNWTSYTTTNGLANNTVRAIAIDGSGNKWFGTYGGGVSKYSGN